MFEEFPGVTVDLERVIPGPRVVIPYFWDRGVQADAIEAAFTDHPGVKRIELIDSIDDEYLLRVEWDPEYVGRNASSIDQCGMDSARVDV